MYIVSTNNGTIIIRKCELLIDYDLANSTIHNLCIPTVIILGTFYNGGRDSMSTLTIKPLNAK